MITHLLTDGGGTDGTKEDFIQQLKDFIFCHPPALLNDMETILDADVAYSHQFVCMPVGFYSMSDKLEKSGFSVGILNLGERLLEKDNIGFKRILEHYIKKHNPKIMGIDLHWWVHSAGAMETARLIKEIDSSVTTLLGGITSSYYAEEIIRDFACIDYILTGECDESIVSFVIYILNGETNLDCIPGLVYRDTKGIRKNTVIPPQDLTKLDITRYDLLLEPATINADRAIIPITRGCVHNCAYCGASNRSFFNIMGRKTVCFLKPGLIVDIIIKNKEKGRKYIYLYGDIQDGGSLFVDEFFDILYKSNIEGIHLVIEFFNLPSKDIIEKWHKIITIKKISLEATISPDSGNDSARKILRRNYTNEQLLDSIQYVYENNIPLSVYFLLGGPEDSDETIDEALKLSDNILSLYSQHFSREKVRHEIIGYEFMQIPDLGSEIYDNTDKFDVTINLDSFGKIVENINNATHWSQLIGFATKHFDQNKFVNQYYRIKYSIYEMYHRHGIIDKASYASKIEKLDKDKANYENIL